MDTTSDLRRKYVNTYVYTYDKIKKTKTVLYVQDIFEESHTNTVMLVAVEQLGETLIDIHRPFVEIEILPRHKKILFDNNGQTFLYSKTPAKQWQRGISEANSRLLSIPMSALCSYPFAEFRLKEPKRAAFNLETFTKLYKEDYSKTLVKAIKEIKDKKIISRAITPSYFIMLVPNKEKPFLLFRYSIPLAYYNDMTNIFYVINEIHSQEINDFIRDQELTSGIGRYV